jgi:RHS repeat-associated protein
MGNRISQEAKAQPQKHYIRDASGNTLAIYEDQNPTELAIYGSARLGAYNTQTQQSQKTLGNRTYELSNHLGNILATITDNKIAEAEQRYRVRLLTLSDYYPFGKEMKGRSWNSKLYRYGFNGKENDHSWGKTIQDYGFRLYSQDYAKFLSVDPLFRSFAWYTPYQFAGNKPIAASDLDGLEERLEIEVRYEEKAYLTGKMTEKELRERQNARGLGAVMGIGLALGWEVLAATATEVGTFATTSWAALRYGGATLTGEQVAQAGGFAWGLFSDTDYPGYADDVTRNARNSSNKLSKNFDYENYGSEFVDDRVFSISDLDYLQDPNSVTKVKYKSLQPTGTVDGTGIPYGKVESKIENGSVYIKVNDSWELANFYTNRGKPKHIDFVITKDGNLVLGNGHYNLSDEAEFVKGAGKLMFVNGKVTNITNNSGHYQLNKKELNKAADRIRTMGIASESMKVSPINPTN